MLSLFYEIHNKLALSYLRDLLSPINNQILVIIMTITEFLDVVDKHSRTILYALDLETRTNVYIFKYCSNKLNTSNNAVKAPSFLAQEITLLVQNIKLRFI